ncbi:MAG: SurA N-terminal domain-containing protein [Spirochaetes bacterium]|nr:SurA N-terminal domain-containing protein [Spirochaetota bacterium]
MRKEDLTWKKVVWYIIIGFFTIIIVISFGMPDFLSRIGRNEFMVATVNGEMIDRLAFVRFRDTFGKNIQARSEKDAARAILNALIEHRLQIQKAKELGIAVSDERVRGFIQSIPIFKNALGSFDQEQYKRYLNHYHFTKAEYFLYVRDNLISSDFYELIESGIAIPPDEVIAENAIENSKIQVKYGYISNWSLKKMFKSELAVSEAELIAEMKKTSEKGKADAATTMAKLEGKKFEQLKGKVLGKIEMYARQGKSFDEVAKEFAAQVSMSPEFRVGDDLLNEKTPKYLLALALDSVFLEDCLMLDVGKTSRAIPISDGILFFTPVKKEVFFAEPDAENYEKIRKKLLKERMSAVYASMMGSFLHKAKIRINPKFSEN